MVAWCLHVRLEFLQQLGTILVMLTVMIGLVLAFIMRYTAQLVRVGQI